MNFSKSSTGLFSRDLFVPLSAGGELLLGTADLFRAFGFVLLFALFIYMVTNCETISLYSNMLTSTMSVGYFVSAVIAPIVLAFTCRRAWASALIGTLGIIPLFVIIW